MFESRSLALFSFGVIIHHALLVRSCGIFSDVEALLDTDLSQCTKILSAPDECTQIQLPNALPNQINFEVILYLQGKDTECGEPFILVYTHVGCITTSGECQMYQQCLLSTTDLLRSDITVCYYTCQCLTPPCDLVFLRTYNLQINAENDELSICEVGITAPGLCEDLTGVFSNLDMEDKSGWNVFSAGISSWETSVSHSGLQSLYISTGPTLSSGATQFLNTELSPYKFFKAKAWSKLVNIGYMERSRFYSLAVFEELEGSSTRKYFYSFFNPNTTEWQSVELMYRVKEKLTAFGVQVSIKKTEGAAYFDDVTVWGSIYSVTDCH